MNLKKVVVIGGGPGGYVAAIRAAQLGAEVTLIEKDKIGGTCLNRGCIPTKALLFDAKLLRTLKRSSVFQSLLREGFNPLEAMMERKKKVVQEIVEGVETLLESHRVKVKRGQADLLGIDQVVLLDGKERREIFDADAIVLATGSKSKILSNIFPDEERVINSERALEIKTVPRSICIVGGGYIGVEFATLFSTLGSNVTVVEIMDDILTGVDSELVRNLRRLFKRDGVKVLTKSAVEDIRHEKDGVRLTVRTLHETQEIVVETLLLCVGRAPVLDLDFSKTGVEASPSGIRVNGRMETTAPHIYAIGDAVGGALLAHVAMEQGEIAAENLMGMERQFVDRIIPLCVFTYPEVASVGLTEDEAAAKGEIKVGRFPFRSNSKALISGETEGLIKVVASRGTDEVLGVHIIGPEASTLISIASSIMSLGGRAKEFSQLLQTHPTTSEAIKEAFLDIDGLAIHHLSVIRERRR